MKKFYILISSTEPHGLSQLISFIGGKCKIKSIGVFNQVEIFSVAGNESDIMEAKKNSRSIPINHFLTESFYL